jgi:hypothetical protein
MYKVDYIINNEKTVLAIDLFYNGEFVVPDDSLYNYKILKSSGEVIYEREGLLVSDQYKDKVTITIPAELNTLEESKLFEDRFIIVNFVYGGGQVRLRKSVRLIKEPYFTASVKDVRSIYGINEGELPDEDLDMTEVYLTMLAALGDDFSEALKSGDRSNFRANRAIALQAALDIFSSLRLRVAESEKSGTNTFLRNLRNIDWNALKAELENELAGIIEDITGESTSYVDNYSPIALGLRSPDAITGEG